MDAQKMGHTPEIRLPHTPGQLPSFSKVDWPTFGEPRHFFGRSAELATIHAWLEDPTCRVVCILGPGGISKSELARQVGFREENSFDFVCGRDLTNAPLLRDVLKPFIQHLSGQSALEQGYDSSRLISKLITLLQSKKTLLVLDNFESILLEGIENRYRDSYSEYGLLIDGLARASHNSVLVITSRVRPFEVPAVLIQTSPIRPLDLIGLEVAEARQILHLLGVDGPEFQEESLVRYYEGDPLYLEIVSAWISLESREIFPPIFLPTVYCRRGWKEFLTKHLNDGIP